jgi:hypothetical protein
VSSTKWPLVEERRPPLPRQAITISANLMWPYVGSVAYHAEHALEEALTSLAGSMGERSSTPDVILRGHRQREEVIASIHNADHARVRAPAAIADMPAPVPVPGRPVVVGIAALPRLSFAHMGRVDRCLVSWCRS